MWEQYKKEQMQKGNWRDNSGRIKNPEKHFFLQNAKNSVHKVNRQRHGDEITYARTAMIMCGLVLNTNGLWEISLLIY